MIGASTAHGTTVIATRPSEIIGPNRGRRVGAEPQERQGGDQQHRP